MRAKLQLTLIGIFFSLTLACSSDPKMPDPPDLEAKLLAIEAPEFNCDIVSPGGPFGELGKINACKASETADKLNNALNLENNEPETPNNSNFEEEWEAAAKALAKKFVADANRVRAGKARRPYASELREGKHPKNWTAECMGNLPGEGGLSRFAWDGCVSGAMEYWTRGMRLAMEECAVTDCRLTDISEPLISQQSCSNRTICPSMMSDGWEAFRSLTPQQKASVISAWNEVMEVLNECAKNFDKATAEAAKKA